MTDRGTSGSPLPEDDGPRAGARHRATDRTHGSEGNATDGTDAVADGPTRQLPRVTTDGPRARPDEHAAREDPAGAVTTVIPVTSGDGTPPAGRPAPAGAAERPRWNRWEVLAWCAPLFLLAIALQGLVPGTAPPALIWADGAGNIECIARLGWSQFTDRCRQFGAPFGSPLLLGLPHTYLGAWFTYLPWIDAWRAYKLVAALSCLAGFAGTLALLRRWSAPVWLAAIGAALFVSSPTLISLNAFTFTFHGYVQLPAYLWLLLRSLDGIRAGRRLAPVLIAFGTCLMAVFTDGYSFIGTAVVVLVVGLGWMLDKELTWPQRWVGVGAWAGSLVVSAGVYLAWIPSGGVNLKVGIGAFRSLGLDVITLFLPGPSYWYAGSAPWRSTLLDLWGDGSNITTNFLGYVALGLVAVVVAFGLLRRSAPGGRERLTLALAGLVSLVLSFGPALKVANFKKEISPSWDVPLSETRTWLPTALLYEHVPGFTEIRATYRIFAVTRFALILLAIVALAALWRSRARWLAPVLAVLLVLEASFNPIKQIRSNEANSDLTAALRTGLLVDLQTLVRPGETMLMLPASNDFLATGLVPFTGATSFNVGVDKNYTLAQAAWPEVVKQAITDFRAGDITASGCALLRTGTADVIVLPFVPLGSGVRTAAPDAALQRKAEKVAAEGEASGTFTVARTATAVSLREGPSCS